MLPVPSEQVRLATEGGNGVAVARGGGLARDLDLQSQVKFFRALRSPSPVAERQIRLVARVAAP